MEDTNLFAPLSVEFTYRHLVEGGKNNREPPLSGVARELYRRRTQRSTFARRSISYSLDFLPRVVKILTDTDGSRCKNNPLEGIPELEWRLNSFWAKQVS